MVTKTITIEELPRVLSEMAKSIKTEAEKTKTKTPRHAGQFMIRTAKRLAPRKTGETEQGIFGYKEGTSYVVQSLVQNPAFKQNLWADVRDVGTKTRGTYPLHQKTGVSGGRFFTRAEEATAKYFEDVVVEDVSKWRIL